MKKQKLYIDIDGVLLGERADDASVCLAPGARDFLGYVLEHFDCYWLTTRANHGDSATALEALRPFAGKEFMALAGKVKPTLWRTLKTEAINFRDDFYWLDDQLLWSEREILEACGCLNRWIRVDTRADLSDLARAKRYLVELIKKI